MRDLPWRRTRDPYALWVSEIMLQQTRVEVVSPRFSAFLRAFPDVGRLARASEERVLSLWSGLGYYSRARHLHRGAALVAEKFAGRFPRDMAGAREIPGIGPYTAAAVLSIAYGLPHAVVDGNVARVLARLHRLDPPEDRSAALLNKLAAELLDPARPGDHNQAMMELGALTCLPRGPRCGECPVSRFCRAFREGAAAQYPRPKTRPRWIDLEPVVLLLRDGAGRLLLEKGRFRILPHLWLPPIAESAAALAAGCFQERLPPLEQLALRELGSFRHAITRHRLRVLALAGRWPSVKIRPSGEVRFVDRESLGGIGRSALLQKALSLEAGGPPMNPAKGGTRR